MGQSRPQIIENTRAVACDKEELSKASLTGTRRMSKIVTMRTASACAFRAWLAMPNSNMQFCTFPFSACHGCNNSPGWQHLDVFCIFALSAGTAGDAKLQKWKNSH